MGDLIRYPVMKTVKDAAAIYGLPPTYIWTLCRTGKIRYVVAGHRWLVKRFTADLYLDPLPDRQNQVRCGWASLAREYEQLGEIFQRGRPRPGRAR